MTSNPISSSPTAATEMSPSRLGLGQMPTIPTSFVEGLEIMGFIGTTRSEEAEEDLEWLESWNPSKVSPVHNGARVIDAGRKSNAVVGLCIKSSRC